jgi:hypothetical protein
VKVEWQVLIWVFWDHCSGGCQESEGVTTALGKTSRVENSDLCCSKSSRYQHSPNSCSERHTGKIRNGCEIFIHAEPQRQGLDLLGEPYCPPPAHRTQCSLARSSDLASALPSISAADRWRGRNRALWCRGKIRELSVDAARKRIFFCTREAVLCPQMLEACATGFTTSEWSVSSLSSFVPGPAVEKGCRRLLGRADSLLAPKVLEGNNHEEGSQLTRCDL